MTQKPMLPRWDEVTLRYLADGERPYPSEKATLPVVVEAGEERSAGFLQALVRRRSSALTALLHEHGAVLLRGFDLADEHDFEGVVMSLDGVRPMANYFMSEPGREQIAGTRAVFNTNSRYKTGGTFVLGGFHAENFYSPDVPALQSFWCKEAPRFGGETGLVQNADAYAELPADLQERCESMRVFAAGYPFAAVAERYQIPEREVEAFCKEVGLFGDSADHGGGIEIFKPAVFRHAQTGRRALQINLGVELKSLNDAMLRLIAPKYVGWRWALHRSGWRHPFVHSLLLAVEAVTQPDPLPFLMGWFVARKKRGTRGMTPPPRISARLTQDDVEVLAGAMCRHLSVFTWRRGDVLLFDNTQVLHSGMPGLGRRALRCMMCNPIPMKHPVASGILDVPPHDPSYEPFVTRLQRYADRRS